MLAAHVLFLLMFAFSPSVQPLADAPAKINLTECKLPDVEGTVKCGTYEVWEDRQAKNGRRISLKIVLFPATGPAAEKVRDPFVFIPGGPGSSATEDSPYVAAEFAKLRQKRDLLFVDQRGTGGSNSLECALFNPAEPQSYLEHFLPLESVRRCRQELEKKANLELYTTDIAMEDLEEVRAALGYDQLNLLGISYGTRAVLTYLRRYPTRVRSAVLHGVAPPNQFMPRDFPLDNERAFQGVLAECAKTPECQKKYPALHAEAKQVLERLLKGPVEVEVRYSTGDGNGESGKLVKVSLSRNLAAEAIRYMLYNPGAVPQIPRSINAAASGNWTPLAEAALRYRRWIVATGSNGMYLSVTCAEDLPWIKPGEGERIAQNTLLGDYRLRQQREACALWPQAKLRSDYASPIHSDRPVLILTGEWDPVTPPSNGDGVAKTLTNSMHVVVPFGGHSFNGLNGIDCITRLTVQFVEQGTSKGLDQSCVSAIKRKGW